MVTARLNTATADTHLARDRGRALLAALAVYFLLQLLVRVTVAGGVEKDEAEQLLWTQTLAWGYGPQPPLYSWLQWAVFRLTGWCRTHHASTEADQGHREHRSHQLTDTHCDHLTAPFSRLPECTSMGTSTSGRRA